MLFSVPQVGKESDKQPRAYSIASMPTEKELLFVVKLKIGGRASQWIEQVLQPRTAVTMQGPFGFFTVTQEPADIVFACTGAGIAPFRSQILDMLAAGDHRKLDLFFGVRTNTDLFWVDTFAALEQQHPNFHFHPCLSGEHSDWSGNKGRVQQFIPASIMNPGNTHLYICGAPEMVADIKKRALEVWGIDKKHVHAEGYI